MKSTALSVVFFLLAFKPSAIAIVGGVSIDNSADSQLQSVFGVESHGPAGSATGTATHIGDGLLLTAYHVPNWAGARGALNVFDLTGKRLSESPVRNFRVLKPQEVSSLKIANMTLSLPDIAIIEFEAPVRDRIRQYPAMPVKTDFMVTMQDILLAVGAGLDSFDSRAKDGSFKLGKVAQVELTPGLGLKTMWSPQAPDDVALRPGDSGGPLLILGEDMKFSLIGVASASDLERGSDGAVNAAHAWFVLLNERNISEWLDQSRKKEVAPQTPKTAVDPMAIYALEVARKSGRFKSEQERAQYILYLLIQEESGGFSLEVAARLATELVTRMDSKVEDVMQPYLCARKLG